MYYVSCKNGNKYGITDTKDGVTEYYTADEILVLLKSVKGLKIKGVSKSGIKIINASQEVIQNTVDKFSEVVRNKVFSYSIEQCEDLASTIHFKKKIKGLEDINQVRQVTYENVYPESVREVVRTASDYTNAVKAIDVTNPSAIRQALMSNVCLVLQHKTNGALTAFICTGSIDIMDKLYEPMLVDKLHLTKTMYDLVERADKLKDVDREKTANPNMLNVFSASLRFRNTGAKHDGLDKEISSIFYSVNMPNVLAMFVLDNPSSMGSNLMNEFYSKVQSGNTSVANYKFDTRIYDIVCQSLSQGIDLFNSNPDLVKNLIDTTQITDKVDIGLIQKKYSEKWGYTSWLRKNGYSFK